LTARLNPAKFQAKGNAFSKEFSASRGCLRLTSLGIQTPYFLIAAELHTLSRVVLLLKAMKRIIIHYEQESKLSP
jgi:hypothetical protein